MKCIKCDEKSTYKDLCKFHFTKYFEKKVKTTIERFNLINKKEKVMVAASGGKDSMTVLHILNKLKYNVTALAIDEGIENYRNNTLALLRNYCEKNKIKLKVVSYKNWVGHTLDEIIKKTNDRPCSVCGTFRRYLLNQHSSEFDVLVTGHNQDDEAQAVLMNLTKNNIDALNRQGPMSGKGNEQKFTKRVKPLYLSSEKEVMFYSSINKLTIDFNCCPNIGRSFRLRLKRSLNNVEVQDNINAKEHIVNWFIEYKKTISKKDSSKVSIKLCSVCGQNTTGNVCKACQYKERLAKCL
jgi:tRNA-5-methyluridine54 2-sulfurtransferase